MEQDGDAIRRSQAGAPSSWQSHTGETRWQCPAPLPFLPGIKEKALPGVTALAPLSQEEGAENKDLTGLPIEGAAPG